MTRFLTVEQAMELVWDEGFVVRDYGLFASAVLRPQTCLFGDDAYETVFEKAAALLQSLTRDHALLDGNKRSGLLLTAVFLRDNGWRLLPSDEMADFIVSVATGSVTLAQSTLWLTRHSERVDQD